MENKTTGKLVKIATFDNPIDMQFIKEKLEQAGIECRVVYGDIFFMDWFHPDVRLGIELQVNESHVVKASEILKGQMKS